MAILHELISIFGEIRKLLAREGNNFDWSSWDDSTDAIAEVDGILTLLRSDPFLPEGKMNFLFLPTGPLQEVSISSGWGDEFCKLADRYDSALKGKECSCFKLSHKNVAFEFIGSTPAHAEISLGRCQSCGQLWLRYFFENEAFTASGRWYLGAISLDQATNLTPEKAKSILEILDWYWFGGSYFNGLNGVSSGQIS